MKLDGIVKGPATSFKGPEKVLRKKTLSCGIKETRLLDLVEDQHPPFFREAQHREGEEKVTAITRKKKNSERDRRRA